MNANRHICSLRMVSACVLLLALTTGLFFHDTAQAQTPQYYYNLATGGNAIPFNPTSANFHKWQGFYNAGLFPGAYAGNITKLYFMRYSASTGTTYSDFNVSIAQSPLTTFPTNQFFTPMTLALSAATYTIPAGATGTWFEIQLTTPVYYDPAQTLIIQVCSNGLAAGTGITAMDGGPAASPNVSRIYGGPSCNAAAAGYNFPYRMNFGFDLSPALPNDASISALVSPVNFCAGLQDIKVKLRNSGTNTLNNVTVNWTYDGIPETPINYNTPLASLAEVELNLGSKTIPAGVAHPLVVWTSQPNGVPDSFMPNDTLRRDLKAAMSGTFTIGGTNPDYPTFAAAIADLIAGGVCGPVVYNVRPGTYTEQVALGNTGTIAGTSAVNTITFQSETLNRADVNVQFTSTTGNPTLYISGVDYVTFRDMTFRQLATNYGIVAYLTGGAEHVTLENLDLVSLPTTTTSTNNAVIYSSSGSLEHYLTVSNCNIMNGSMGAYLYGGSTTSTENNSVIQGCTFTGQYYTPVYCYYLGQLQFLDNTVLYTSAYTSKYLAYFMYGFNTSVERNRFLGTGGTYNYGIYYYYDNYYQAGNSRFVNNFITVSGTTSTTYGLRPYNCYNQLIAHNTIVISTPYTSAYAVYTYNGQNQQYLNNIFYNTGLGRAWYVNSPAAVIASDYNDIYTQGAILAYWSGDRVDINALRAASGMDQHSLSKAATYRDAANGDLHLAGGSEDDDDLVGTLLTAVTDDIDHDPRVRPYKGADEACYLIPNSLTYDFVDGSGNPIGYAQLPGTIGIHYRVIFPDFDATIQMTANFYSVPANQLMYSTTFSANKLAGLPLDGTAYFTLPGTLPSGYYRIELVFNTKNSCGYYRDYMPYPSSLLLVPSGSLPCEVWPGDVNNDGVVNYGDRRDLNLYIYNANLSPLWLNGPARYRADAAQNPLTYLAWQPQASAPWYTADGCYKDADGNGIVNNFDYIAIKLNWMKTHGAVPPKARHDFMPGTFDMSQNYANPFNPTTTIRYSLPERSLVHLRIVDILGRDIAVAVNGAVESGVYEYTFDARALPSGLYFAIVDMTGEESGLGFSKTIKMSLNK